MTEIEELVMQTEDRKHKPYELLGEMAQSTPPQGLSADNHNATQELTTAYITTLYYSALANLYVQTALPDTLEELDGENPRLKVALTRSYADFAAAQNWLDKNGGEFIATSTAKHYYDEVQGMEKDTVMDADSFYTQSHK